VIAPVSRSTRLRVVLDTNVLLSGIFFGGVPGRLPTADDDKFLACAIASPAPLIVSGDKHVLYVSGWSGITVVTPRQCVDRYLAADEDAAPE
jgi:predicted nucleic acid-binding protein